MAAGRIREDRKKRTKGLCLSASRRRMCKQQRHLHFIGAATNGRIFVKLQPSALVLLFNFRRVQKPFGYKVRAKQSNHFQRRKKKRLNSVIANTTGEN